MQLTANASTLIRPGRPVEILPAYEMATRARTGRDAFVGPATVVEVSTHDVLVDVRGREVWIARTRIEVRS